MRTVFQRDRDRIVHSKAFRRLKDKTQVFMAPQGDHYRVRLTHTLDVSHIARTVARALRLNEDLTEAIALGHDLGHTPFGHLGEQALTPFLDRPFRHTEQSLRVVDHLENDGEGLNLTWEVRDGILHHPWTMPEPSTLEAQIVRFADRIAYVNHDIDDAIRAGVLEAGELPTGPLDVLGPPTRERIDTLVRDLVTTSEDRTGDPAVADGVRGAGRASRLHVRRGVPARERSRRAGEGRDVDPGSLRHFLDHPEELPPEYHHASGDLPTRVADYIAGMTDRYALRTYERLFLPRGWLFDCSHVVARRPPGPGRTHPRGRHRSRQRADRHRRARRAVPHPEEGGPRPVRRPVPLPSGEDAVVQHLPVQAGLLLLRMRKGGDASSSSGSSST